MIKYGACTYSSPRDDVSMHGLLLFNYKFYGHGNQIYSKGNAIVIYTIIKQ